MLFQLLCLLAEGIDVAICHIGGTGDDLSVLAYNPIGSLRLLLEIARQGEHVLCDLLLRCGMKLDRLIHVVAGHGLSIGGGATIIHATSPAQCVGICKREGGRELADIEKGKRVNPFYLAADPCAAHCAWPCSAAASSPAVPHRLLPHFH